MAMKKWYVEVRVFFDIDGDLTVEREDDFSTAITKIRDCTSITRQPDGWVIFTFRLDAASATSALSGAAQKVDYVWASWFVPRLALVSKVESRAVRYEQWLEEIDPEGKIRAWAEQDFSKLPLPSVEEQQRLLAALDGESDG